jgi:hypothetical protein
MSSALITQIQSKIYDFRGQRVMLDSDLAEYYGIETKYLNRAVKRNPHLFPSDFMFQLTDDEAESLRFKIGTTNKRGGSRYNPHVFSEKGAWTLSFLLNSQEANLKGIQLIRALEELRDFAKSRIQEIPGATQHLLTSPTSIVNHFHGSVIIQQGNNNSQVNITRESVIAELLVMKFAEKDQAMIDLFQKLADQLAKKEEKHTILKTFSSIEKVAGAATAIAKFCEKIAPYIHNIHW